MENVQQDLGALLKDAGTVPAGVVLEKWNPMENVPTAAIGKDILPGMVIAGYFEGTQRAVSAKFQNSQERDAETGLPVQYLHVFRLAKTGKKLGIWSTGELKQICEKLSLNELVRITYDGKRENAQGRQQHFFNYEKVKVAAPITN